MKRIFGICAALLLTVAASASAEAAETVHLFLKANGADILGDSSQNSLGRANSIECVYYNQEVTTGSEVGGGRVGRRQYGAITCRKRIDRSSPLLLKALIENAVITGEFRFFRPNPVGDGTTQQFYTVEISSARIASVRQYTPDTLIPATATLPDLEEVTFVFQTIEWTYKPNGTTMTDTFSAR